MTITITRFLATCGLAACALLAAEEGAKGPRLSNLGGEISRIESQSVTIASKGDSGGSEKTVTVNAGTRIQLETDQTEGGGEGGRSRRVVKAGTIADLAVGQRVRAAVQDDGAAASITVLHVAPKAGKEGG